MTLAELEAASAEALAAELSELREAARHALYALDDLAADDRRATFPYASTLERLRAALGEGV